MLVCGQADEGKSSALDGDFSTGGAQSSSTSITALGNPCGHLDKEHYCFSTWQAAANTPSVTLHGPDLPPLLQQENGLNASTEHRRWFQTSPCFASSWYKGCRQKPEACPLKWLSLMSCCASVSSACVPERTALAKDWAGIVIATETTAGWGAVRCCNLENSWTSYTREDGSKMDVGTWVCLCRVSIFTYACPCCHSVCFAAKTWHYKVSFERVKSSPWTSLKSLLFFLFTHQPDLFQDSLLPGLLPNFTVKLPSDFFFPGKL